MVFSGYASAEAVLSQDEKEIGVLVIDIGGGTTDVALYMDGSVRHSFVIPLGGQNVTKDISYGLKTPDAAAEMIKLSSGCASSAVVNPHEVIEVPGVGGRTPKKMDKLILTSIIEPRAEEILGLIHKELFHKGLLKHLSAGVVLTGGTALMPGVVELSERIFSLPSRVGHPRGLNKSGLNDIVSVPSCATAIGLARYGFRHNSSEYQDLRSVGSAAGKSVGKIKSKVSDFFKEFFG